MFRLSDVVGARAFDREGRAIGWVTDVRLVQRTGDGAITLTVEDLVVGRRKSEGRIHALVRPDAAGPMIVRLMARWYLRHTTTYAWADVESFRPGSITLKT